ncbi:MAG: 1-acyl-sn-glycerol-3-phosphate acyltransferase [Novosphingobium sp.]
MVRGFVLWLYRRKDMRLEGQPPKSRRCIIVGAPHTSNWDFVFFLGATHEWGIEPSFMGKKSLFRWPLKRFMYDMGGVAVDRSKRGNYVEEMAAEFARREELRLVIAPEGTRGDINRWRSGFYHMALAARVPIVCAWVDLPARRGGMGEEIEPSGDFAADLKRIALYYRSVMPDHPKLQALFAQAGI